MTDHGQRVLVTGAAGFLGANLVPALIDAGYSVVGLDNLSQGQRERLSGLPDGAFTLVEADVLDAAAVKKAASGVNCIIHLAELKIPRYGSTLETLQVNVLGTEHLLDAAVEEKAAFILGSTDEVYGKNPDGILNEESALVMGQTNVNRWSLGVSKLMAEQLCFAYAQDHGVSATILRYFGGYGPHQALDWQGGAPSVFITAALQDRPIPIHGNGLQTRTLTSVQDLVAGTVLALESPYSGGEILNLASAESINIVNLAYLIWRLSGNKKKPQLEFVPYTDFSRNYEDVEHRTADISKARHLLGYEPAVSLSDGLAETLKWQAGVL